MRTRIRLILTVLVTSLIISSWIFDFFSLVVSTIIIGLAVYWTLGKVGK
jgi:hypothetical protein